MLHSCQPRSEQLTNFIDSCRRNAANTSSGTKQSLYSRREKLLQIIDIGCITGLLYPIPNPGGFNVTLLRFQTVLVCVLLILNCLSVQASSPPKKKKKKFRGSDK